MNCLPPLGLRVLFHRVQPTQPTVVDVDVLATEVTQVQDRILRRP